jgi:hypothetical protein
VRVRVLVPASHEVEHSLHTPKSESTQSTGPGEVLHACVSASVGQPTPPFWSVRVTARERSCVPPPHVAVQGPQAAHEETSQSTAHACVLHACDSVVAPHATPPCWEAISMVRERDWVPLPQV